MLGLGMVKAELDGVRQLIVQYLAYLSLQMWQQLEVHALTLH